MLASKENDYRNYGLIGTVVFHGGLLAIFLLMVFKGPNPPLDGGGSGIELNYGVLGEEGFGDVQTLAKANDSPNKEDSRPAAKAPEAVPQQQVVQQKAVEATPDRVVTGVEESGVNVKEVVEKPKKVEVQKEEVKAVEKPKSLYPGKSNVQTGANGVAGSSNEATGNNNGDRPGKVGDQGNPEGTLEAKALYGKPGRGGEGDGTGLSMPGWKFDNLRKPNDNSNESGRIVFNIKVDEDGNITRCEVRESNVSPSLTKLYRDAVIRSSLVPDNASGKATTGASGTVTFIISAR